VAIGSTGSTGSRSSRTAGHPLTGGRNWGNPSAHRGAWREERAGGQAAEPPQEMQA